MLFSELTLVEDREPHGAALNMALDEALLDLAEGPLLRYYRWARPAVSFGYFGAYPEVERAWPEREPVRRWTGGGVVLHREDFTYSLIAPRGFPLAEMSAPEGYRRVHEAVAQAFGGAASLSQASAAKISAACFENPAESDVMMAGRKIAGAAQRRTRRGLLHQGSVQGQGEEFGERLAAALGERVVRRELRAGELEKGKEVVERKYGTEAWLHGAGRKGVLQMASDQETRDR